MGLHERSEFGVQAPRIEYACRIEGLLQAMVNSQQSAGKRREHPARFVGATNQRGMSACPRGGRTHKPRFGAGAPPALRAVPLDDLPARQFDRRGGARQGQTPETFSTLQIRAVEGKKIL